MVEVVQITGHFTLHIILVLHRERKGPIDTNKIASVMSIFESISVWLSVIGLRRGGAVVLLEELLDGAEDTIEGIAVQREQASF